MSRLFETLIKKNVRHLVQNVNSFVGRVVSTSEHGSEQVHHGKRSIREVGLDNGPTQYRGDDRGSSCTCQPSSLWFSAVVGGSTVIQIATGLWNYNRSDNYSGEGPSLLNRFFSPIGIDCAISSMRDEGRSKVKFKVVKDPDCAAAKEKPHQVDALETVLFASEEEQCDRMNKQGALFAERGEWNKAVKFFKSAAKNDFPPAQFNLAVFYHTVSRDLDLAEALYSKAAQNGHREAAYNLSTILIEKRSPKWESAMQKAAELGLESAQNYLAGYYFTNECYTQSRAYYKQLRMSSGGSHVYSYWIGRCYEAEGKLVLADLWYQEAAKSNDEIAVAAADRCRHMGLRCTLPPLTQSASSASLLERQDFSVKTRLMSEKTEVRKKANFFIPLQVNDETDEDTSSELYSIPTVLLHGFGKPYTESLRRTQSGVK